MEIFRNAKTVRLRSHAKKYLFADYDKESVIQGRNGGSKQARWSVEFVNPATELCIIRLVSCYNKYLTATDEHFLLGVTGKKVEQRTPQRLDSSVEWDVLRDGTQIKLKTRYGNFLRANKGVPPWRNSITHDVPSRSHTQDWIIWDVDVMNVNPPPPLVKEEPKEVEMEVEEEECEDDLQPFSLKSSWVERSELCDFGESSGRTIYYNVVDDNGDIVEGNGSLLFKGHGLQELALVLEEETGLTNFTVCSRSPLNGNLYPMKLRLPPNHVKLHVYVVPESSRAAVKLITI